MLEIIALIFLAREIGNLAEQKGQHAGEWKLYLVLGWIFAEVIGFLLATQMLGMELFPAMMLGIACGITIYLVLKASLNRRPDVFEDEVDEIGQDYHNNNEREQ